MAQHVSVQPMTREQELEYAVALRVKAVSLRAETPPDERSAELNTHMAALYEKGRD